MNVKHAVCSLRLSPTYQLPVSAFRVLLSNLFVCSLTDNLREGAEKKVVFITGRVHPGETPSSFVCQGIIDFLISQHPIAHVLREHLVFKIAPMLNPDGVYLGNYRCSLMGFDLNRHWLDPSPWAHPTLHGVKQLIIQMYNDPKTSLEFYIDIHAHSTMMNGFMYGNIFEDEERFQRQAIFPKLLCQNAEDFSYVGQEFSLGNPLAPPPFYFTSLPPHSVQLGSTLREPSSRPGPVCVRKIQANKLCPGPRAAPHPPGGRLWKGSPGSF
uniref:Peptidase M14 domain-containing protein n=1 Tax=Canis lupus dingo TaxID=286419 RepID=A0A8C0KPB0_CANLU